MDRAKKYRAVIFDLFGTLVDNFSRTSYDRVLKDMASVLKVHEDDFARAWRDSFPERVNGSHASHQESIEYVCRRLGVRCSKVQVERAAALRLDYTSRTMIARPDAVKTITTVRRSGYKTALISDCSHETPAVWGQTPFATLFDVTVFSCVAGMKKPDPRIYRLATESLGVKPEECLYVGDGSSRELSGARAVGMYPVMIRDPGETTDTHYIEREDDWDGPRISFLSEVLGLLD
jgi:putative hydrolase of the HAD superfamily